MGIFNFSKREQNRWTKENDDAINSRVEKALDEQLNLQTDQHVEKAPYFVSDAGKARYLFEHQILRDQFYSNAAQFINYIIQKDGLYDLSCFGANYGNYENPYKTGDFTVDALRWNKDISMISIECPIPEYTPLCYRIHLLFSDCFDNLGYYTIESGKGNNAFLCGWDHTGNHLNFREMASAIWPEDVKRLHKSMEAEIIIKLHADIHKLNGDMNDDMEVQR